MFFSYGKSKEAFGWPEETEEVTSANNTTGNNQITNANDAEPLTSNNALPITNLERYNKTKNKTVRKSNIFRLVTRILDVLDGTFTLYSMDDKLNTFKTLTIKTTTKLLTMPTPPSIQMYSKSLLSALYTTKQQYHNYKVSFNLFSIPTTVVYFNSFVFKGSSSSPTCIGKSYKHV